MENLKFTLIICTYLRPRSVLLLLDSIKIQTLYPDQILIIDGSDNDDTAIIFDSTTFLNTAYYKVDSSNRGLTKQRNFGISKINKATDIVCFLDDDTICEPNYFFNIIKTYIDFPDAIGVGGIARNENKWQLNKDKLVTNNKFFVLDGYFVKESTRNYLRNLLGLNSLELSGIMPKFSHGRTFSYPLNNKVYPVDLLVGMSMSFKKSVFDKIKFSEYFEGYGLYEDADFSIRALQFGQNYITTAAILIHNHDAAGRPNLYKYGKMVVLNGWYVWRIKYPKPSLSSKIKWYEISILLMLIRLINGFTTNKKTESFTEFIGRFIGLLHLIFNKPSKPKSS